MHFILFMLIAILFRAKADAYSDVKSSKNFTGKVVLVTGSTSGLGEETVKLFSTLGASVVITGRNETSLRKIGEEVTKLSPQGLQPLEVIAELENEIEVEKLLNKTICKFGRLDILVNNAGTSIPQQDIKSDKILKIFDTTFAQNLRPIIQLIHLAIPYLEKSKGTIINTSSISGIEPKPECLLTYNMAKAGLEMMCKVLAVELGPSGIRVNNVLPGTFPTKLASRQGINVDELYKNITKITPLQRLGEKRDIANAIVFLASSNAEFITGVSLIVDGGLHFNMPAKTYF